MKKVKRLLLFGVIAFIVGTVTILNENTEMLGFFLMLAGIVLLLTGVVLALISGVKSLRNKKGTSGVMSSTSVNLSGKEQEGSSIKADNKEFIISRATEVMEKSLSEYRNKCKEFNEELSSIPRVPINQTSKIKRRKTAFLAEVKLSNITRKTRIDKLFPLVVIDTETTGLKPTSCEIIEVSAIKYEKDFTPSSCFTTLCKPSCPIPQAASDVNHIYDEMVQNEPQFSSVAGEFMDYIAGCNIVGHNLPFDIKFLYMSGVDFSENVRYFDTLDLAKKVLTAKNNYVYDPIEGKYEPCDNYDVDNYKLATLCDYYGINRDDAHRSLSDCLATGKLFQNLISDKTKPSV